MKQSAAKQQEPVAETEAEAGSMEESDRSRSDKHSVTIRLGGKEYRLRSEATQESLQQVADYVDAAMQRIRERTDTVDSQDVALLASLNLAREVLHLREQVEASGGGSGARLQALIEQIEAELPVASA